MKFLSKVSYRGYKINTTILVAIVILAILLVLIAITLTKPERLVASYCKVFQEERSRLTTLPGSTYSSGVFNKQLSDAGEFAASFNRLESVAPSDIKPDVSTLKSIYQKIHSDPSQAITASLSGLSAEDNVTKWTRSQCSK